MARPFDERLLDESFATYRADREHLLCLAKENGECWMRSKQEWLWRMTSIAPDNCVVKSSVNMTHWYMTGLQSVEVSHKLAAALMASSAKGALDGVRLPWPCFEVRVPPGLVSSSHGEIISVIVGETPDWLPIERGPDKSGVVVTYYDDRSIGHMAFSNVDQLATMERFGDEYEHIRPDLLVDYDRSHEDRTRLMLLRLIVGVVLLVNTARADKPQSYPAHPRRPDKRSVPRANTHQLKRTVTIDCVASIRDFVRGEGRDSPHVTTLVRGHWRNQPHGQGRQLRRMQFIEPFWRGEGPLVERTTRVKGEADHA